MKRLFLLRHAKASRDKPGVEDENRVLTARGRMDAARLGRFLREESRIPELVLCSTAVRTRETIERLLPEFGARTSVQYLSELYLARAETILSIARSAREAVGSLMIVGHNPGLEYCAQTLARLPADRKMRKLYQAMMEKFPTSALAVLDFETAEWSGVSAGAGELEIFVRPKDFQGTGAEE